jgi:exopolyphosphatase/guanosine-5'-triphosphate,3'-diphosphate pyrophosphatase
VKTAVIDIGTNTLLLLIVGADGAPVVDLCRFGRLGRGLDASGRLDERAIADSLEICREYRRVMDEHGVARPIVVATQAMREARNAADFMAPAEAILGAAIEVIGGEREAELAFVAVARTFPELAGAPYVVVDVGGGSTEFVATDGARVTAAASVPIGAVRLTERHLLTDPPAPEELRALTLDIDRQLEGHLGALAMPRGAPVVGTAGTATTLAAMELGLTAHDSAAVTGVRITPATAFAHVARLLAATIAERREMRGVEPKRADVIAGGAAIYARVLQRLGAPVLITCDRGIRWGLAFEQLGWPA